MGVKFTIDPGHVKGYNAGVVAGYAEGTKMFTLATFLKEELEKYSGFTAVLTRATVSQDPSLDERGQLAVNNGSKVFLSLHSNAFSSATAKGVVLFYSVKLPGSKELSDKLGNAITELMKDGTGVTYYRGSQTMLYPDTNNTDYYGVIRSSVKGGSVENSFLIEHGFHSNQQECEWLNDDNNLRKLAQLEAAVFAEQYGASKNGTSTPTQEAPNAPTSFNAGDVVQFTGGSVYVSSNADTAATTKPESTCKVTSTFNGKHQYHLVSQDGKGVYGWVDAECVTVCGKNSEGVSNTTGEQTAFIEKIGAMATEDMKKSGVLACLTIAQAILESAWGKSGLTSAANNLFGIKGSYNGAFYACETQEWDGEKFITVTAQFRKYPSLAESIADHSALFNTKDRYANLRGLDNYKLACQYVREDGYATDPEYTNKLINIIEKYNLTRFYAETEAQSQPEEAPKAPTSYNVGDVVQFTGGSVYVSSNADTVATTKSESTCKVTSTFNGKHQYHLVSLDGKGVYGWVDAEYITGAKEEAKNQPASEAPHTEIPATRFNTGDTVQFTGGNVYLSGDADTAAAMKPASTCKVTNTYKGKHTYHLVSQDGKGVYGWVDASCVAEEGAQIETPRELKQGCKVQYSGTLYADSFGGGPGKTVNGTYIVSRYIPGRKCDVLLGSVGWVPESDCKVVG